MNGAMEKNVGVSFEGRDLRFEALEGVTRHLLAVMAEFNEAIIRHPLGEKARERAAALMNFFQKNNGENARVVAIGLSCMFGVMGYELVEYLQERYGAGSGSDIIQNIKLYLQNYPTENALAALGRGVSSAAVQKTLEVFMRRWREIQAIFETPERLATKS